MKNHKGFSVAGVVIGIIVVGLLAFATYSVIDANNKATDFEKYSDNGFCNIIEANQDNGDIADHIKGDPKAPVVIYEYADFQCPGCASVNPKVNKAVKELDGKLAIVYRNNLLSYHKNGTAAASAAEAAGLQQNENGESYWKPYADKLFAEQAEWEAATGSERTALFNKYFMEVTEDKGNLDQFNSDLASEKVSKKISFDMGIGRRLDIPSTPAFYIDGQIINWSQAGELQLNGETISWESGRSGDDFIKLLQEIVEVKTK